jgi:SNF2 family DNA or RNA helicase
MEACLFYMAMGCGKSKCVVDLLCCDLKQRNQDLKVLILCPLSVVPVWPHEIETHRHDFLEINVLPLAKGSVQKKTDLALGHLAGTQDSPSIKVVVINYDSAREAIFAKFSLHEYWDWVILDESHKLKSPTGKTSRYCAKLRDRASRRLCLTGTPMPRDPLDLWAQFRFLDPTIFGTSYGSFKARYAVMGGYKVHNKPVQVVGFRDQDDLARRMDTITFRADETVLDLPDATHTTRFFSLNEAEENAYKAMENSFVVELKSKTGGDPQLISAGNVLVELLRLQQITCGFIQDRDAGIFERLGHTKENLLLELLEDIGTEPVSVYCHFTEDLRAVERCAEKLGRRYGEVSGQRKDIDGRWVGDGRAGPEVLALQIQAGGLGIDLTRARYQIYYSLSYGMGDYEQSLKRIHRPGQIKPVTYIHLVAEGTTDERVRKALRKKKSIVEAIRGMLT